MHLQGLICPQCGAALPVTRYDNITCQYCGTHLIQQSSEKSSAQQTSILVQGMKFVPFQCVDTNGTGLEAFHLLIPAGWGVRGGIIWLPDNPGMPATMSFMVYNPAGFEAFEAFPTLPFYWSTHPLLLMTNPIGSKYFGNEVREPNRSAEEAMRQITLPRFRNFLDLRIVKIEHMPELTQAYRSLSPNPTPSISQLDGAKARIQYPTDQQSSVEEDITCVLEINALNSQSMFGGNEMIFWNVTFQMATRAAVGKLESASQIFKTILGSFTLNPQWFNMVVSISQHMIRNQIQHIHNIGQLSRTLSQNADYIRETNTQSYERQQQMMDRVSQQFSQTIREVDSYIDPNSNHEIELPTGYAQAWSNPLGEYIVSADPTYNPNQQSNQTWTPLIKKTP